MTRSPRPVPRQNVGVPASPSGHSRAEPEEVSVPNAEDVIALSGFVKFVEFLEWDERRRGPARYVRPEAIISVRYFDSIFCFDGTEYEVGEILLSTGDTVKVRGEIDEILAAIAAASAMSAFGQDAEERLEAKPASAVPERQTPQPVQSPPLSQGDE